MTIQCINCGTRDVTDWGKCRDVQLPAGVHRAEVRMTQAAEDTRLCYCGQCGLAFRFPAITEELVIETYSNLPDARWERCSENISWTMARRFIRQQWGERQEISILDIGAYQGDFLLSLPESWHKAAIEPSQVGRNALQAHQIDVLGEFVENSVPRAGDHFDIVTMFDVFEHTSSPDTAMRTAVSHLRKGGILIVSTGTCDHWTWKLLRGSHWYLASAQHVCVGTKKYFSRCAAMLGMSVILSKRHAHKSQGIRDVVCQASETLIYGGRLSDSWTLRSVARACLRMPRLSRLRDREYGPYAPGLKDHLFVVLKKDG